MESDPLGKVIGIGSGGGTNLSEGKTPTVAHSAGGVR